VFISKIPPQPASVPASKRTPKRPHPLARKRLINLGRDPERFSLVGIFHAELQAARQNGDENAAAWWAWRLADLDRGETVHLVDHEMGLLAAGYFLLAAQSRGRASNVMWERGRLWWRRSGRKAMPRISRRSIYESENPFAILCKEFSDGRARGN